MLLDEIANYLQTAGLGEVDQDLFKGVRPDDPAICTTLAERPSMPPIGTQENAIRLERPRIQVVCRGGADDYLGPRSQAELIYRSLALIRGMTLGTAQYIAVIPSPPFLVGRDANARYLICVNAEVTKTPS